MSNDQYQADEREIDRFDARMFGDMPQAEIQAFDHELEQDVEMRQRYDAYLKAVKAVEVRSGAGRSDREQLRAELSKVDRELDQRRPQRWWWAAAATVAVGLGALWMLLPNKQDLFAEFALPEPGLPVLMSSASDHRIEEIMNSYKLERYEEAEKLLADALTEAPENDTLRYFAGVVAQRLHGCEAAMEHHGLVARSRFAERARYQMALCQLQAGDTALARAQLDALQAATDHQVRDFSRRLRDRL